MSEADKAQFIESIQYDGVMAVNQMIGRIDVRNSDAFKQSDKKLIFAVVESTIGFNGVNSLILEHMRNWVIQTTEAAIDELPAEESSKKLRLTSAVADLYMQQGLYDRSERLYSGVLSTATATYGATHPYTLTAGGNLAILYNRQGRLSDAEPLYLQCYERNRETHGVNHVDTLECELI